MTAADALRNPRIASAAGLVPAPAANSPHDHHHQGTAAVTKPSALQTLAGHRQDEGQSSPRCLVRITTYRTRKQDPDNGIVKWHVDALRFAGIIHDDTEEDIKLEVSQVRIGTKAEEKTIIEVTAI